MDAVLNPAHEIVYSSASVFAQHKYFYFLCKSFARLGTQPCLCLPWSRRRWCRMSQEAEEMGFGKAGNAGYPSPAGDQRVACNQNVCFAAPVLTESDYTK